MIKMIIDYEERKKKNSQDVSVKNASQMNEEKEKKALEEKERIEKKKQEAEEKEWVEMEKKEKEEEKEKQEREKKASEEKERIEKKEKQEAEEKEKKEMGGKAVTTSPDFIWEASTETYVPFREDDGMKTFRALKWLQTPDAATVLNFVKRVWAGDFNCIDPSPFKRVNALLEAFRAGHPLNNLVLMWAGHSYNNLFMEKAMQFYQHYSKVSKTLEKEPEMMDAWKRAVFGPADNKELFSLCSNLIVNCHDHRDLLVHLQCYVTRLSIYNKGDERVVRLIKFVDSCSDFPLRIDNPLFRVTASEASEAVSSVASMKEEVQRLKSELAAKERDLEKANASLIYWQDELADVRSAWKIQESQQKEKLEKMQQERDSAISKIRSVVDNEKELLEARQQLADSTKEMDAIKAKKMGERRVVLMTASSCKREMSRFILIQSFCTSGWMWTYNILSDGNAVDGLNMKNSWGKYMYITPRKIAMYLRAIVFHEFGLQDTFTGKQPLLISMEEFATLEGMIRDVFLPVIGNVPDQLSAQFEKLFGELAKKYGISVHDVYCELEQIVDRWFSVRGSAILGDKNSLLDFYPALKTRMERPAASLSF